MKKFYVAFSPDLRYVGNAFVIRVRAVQVDGGLELPEHCVACAHYLSDLAKHPLYGQADPLPFLERQIAQIYYGCILNNMINKTL